MTEPVPMREGCPFGGFHRVRQWVGAERQGLSCDRCKKTWTATEASFVPTYANPHHPA